MVGISDLFASTLHFQDFSFVWSNIELCCTGLQHQVVHNRITIYLPHYLFYFKAGLLLQKIQRTQNWKPIDFLTIPQWEQYEVNDNFEELIFSDESHFLPDGYVKRYLNYRIHENESILKELQCGEATRSAPIRTDSSVQ